MTQLDDILAAVDHADHRAIWAEGWERSQAAASPDADDLLDSARLRATCDWLNMTAAPRNRLLHAAAAVDADPVLRPLAVHIDWTLGVDNDAASQRRAWPALPERLGEVGRLFYGVAFLAAIRRARRRHARLNISETISRDTLCDFELHIRTYHERCGCWGFAETFWLSGHLRGRIYRLGRLQFELDHLGQDFHLLRRKAAPREINLLAGDGMAFRGDGQFADADRGIDRHHSWHAGFRRDGRSIHGHPITPDGRALPEPVDLPADEWEYLAGKGDAVLGVHIPAIGPMTPDACSASFEQAMSFFAAHFPEHRFRALTCSSWLLDPQLAQHLPAESNIVRFQQVFHLHPWPGGDDQQTLERIFPGREHLPIDQLPQTTSLQRIVAQHIRAGERWRMTGGIVARGDELSRR